MGFIVAQVFGHAAFGLIMRHARTDPQTYFKVGAVNYWTAMLMALTAALVAGGLSFEWPVSLLAVYQGVNYHFAYIVLFALIAVGGLAVTFTVLRISVVIPIVGSIIFWGESPDAVRIVGIILTLAALPLLGADARRTAGPAGVRTPALLMLLTMLMTGTGSLAAKSFAEMSTESNALDYAAFAFIGAAVGTILTSPLVSRIARRHRETNRAVEYPAVRPWKTWLVLGMALGAANFSQNAAMVRALTELPGTLVFPVVLSSYLLLILLADYVIWKRRLGRVTLAGVFLAIGGLVLANL